jgi:hypothetical protein
MNRPSPTHESEVTEPPEVDAQIICLLDSIISLKKVSVNDSLSAAVITGIITNRIYPGEISILCAATRFCVVKNRPVVSSVGAQGANT